MTSRPSPPTAPRRRDLLLGAGALVGAAAARSLGRPALAQAPEEITFSFAPDRSGSTQALIDAFNQAQDGRVRVRWLEMPVDTDDYRRLLESDFRVGASEIDVIGADVIWTAEFAYRRWAQDLTDRFNRSYRLDAFLKASLESTAFQNRIWAVPWFADVGMLYYRRDLLERSGFPEPPRTWDELERMALKVKQDAGVPHGFVFQGAAYEGGVANACEFIWSAGGRVMTTNVAVSGTLAPPVAGPNASVIDSADAARGLDTARGLIARGVAPAEVATFNEQDALRVFAAGEAVFMRGWPFAYGILRQGGGPVSADQVGIAPIPTTAANLPSFGCLGGWNLMISALSRRTPAAWEFIRFAVSPEQQRRHAQAGGFLPTLRALYDEPAIGQELPVTRVGLPAIRSARTRPASPFYPEISARIALAFNRVLRGELDGRTAVRRLDAEFRTILRRSR